MSWPLLQLMYGASDASEEALTNETFLWGSIATRFNSWPAVSCDGKFSLPFQIICSTKIKHHALPWIHFINSADYSTMSKWFNLQRSRNLEILGCRWWGILVLCLVRWPNLHFHSPMCRYGLAWRSLSSLKGIPTQWLSLFRWRCLLAACWVKMSTNELEGGQYREKKIKTWVAEERKLFLETRGSAEKSLVTLGPKQIQ